MKNFPKTSVFVIALFLLFNFNSFAQYPPTIQWQNVSWEMDDIYGNPKAQTQAQSGEDWWYSHKNVYNTSSVHTGYITVGFSNLVTTSSTFATAQQLFNEGSASCYNPVQFVQDPYNPSCFDFDYTTTCPEGCTDRDYVGEHRSPPRGTVSLNDLNGNMVWCNEYVDGEIQEVIQDGQIFYIVGRCYGARPFNVKTAFIPYNPTSARPADYFDVSNGSLGLSCSINAATHFFIAKLDMSGNVIWSGLYGMPDFVSGANIAMNSFSYGYDIIKSSNGNLIASGIASPFNTPNYQPFVLEIDPASGYLINKTLLPITGANVISATGCTTIYSGESHSLVQINSTPINYAVACTYVYSGCPNDNNEACVWNLDVNLNPSASWPTNPLRFPGNGLPNYNSNLSELKYHSAKNELLVPLIQNCNNCSFAGNNDGTGYIYRVTPSGGLSTMGTNPAFMSALNAFDLRIGIEETPDGGYVAVSTRRNQAFVPPTTTELGYLSGCNISGNDISTTYGYWDTDPVVVKFDANSVQQWIKTFDVQPGRARQTPPGDLKRQECLYKISVAQDGGYVVSGNASHNFDDNYLFKLYTDCEANITYDITGSGNVIPINGSVTWNSSHTVIGMVTVNPGATLTITGNLTTIQFADTKLTGIPTGITVMPGGQLNIINGAKLTNITTCPSSMWDGVVLIGTTLSQTSANQSNAFLSVGTIENARLGISVGTQLTTNKNGAYVRASNFNFINNNIDVQFFPYKNIVSGVEQNNISYLNLCKFEGNKELNDPVYTVATQPSVRRTTDKHLWLNQVKGIKIIGCNFNTVLTGLIGGNNYPSDGRSYGIYSTDALFTVSRSCSVMIGGQCAGAVTNFNYLRYGIYAQATNTLRTFNVTETNFTNCFASIYESGISYSTVDKNKFLITATLPGIGGKGCFTNPGSSNCLCYFHYLNQCNGFSHQENDFKVTGTTQSVIGTIFNNEGNAANISYRNTYSGLLVSNQSQLTNGTTNTFGGLQIKCNLSSGVTSNDILQTSGAIGKQGICIGIDPKATANNTFTHLLTGSLDNDIKAVISSSGFQYNYNPNPNTGTQLQKPFYVSSNIFANGCTGGLSQFNYTNDCPSNFSTPCNINCQTQRVTNYLQQADNINQSILAGDAPALYAAINGNTSPGNLKNLLMSKSPYLSDGVLIAYLQRTNTPSPGNIKDIIIANSPVSVQVKTVIDNMSLPNGIRNQINAAQTGTSARQQQADLVAYYNQQAQYASNEIIRALLNDTTVTNADAQIKQLLESSRSVISKADLAQISISTGNYTRAQTLIDSIAPLTGMSKISAHLQNRKNLHQQNKTWYELNTDAALKQSVMQIASDSLSAGSGNARSAMALVYSTDNYEVIEGNNVSSRVANSNNANEEKNTVTGTNLLNAIAYPNPFNNELTVKYTFTEANSANCISLIEVGTGRVLQQKICAAENGTILFNTEALSNGLYFISVQEKNKPTTFIKVVNIKQ